MCIWRRVTKTNWIKRKSNLMVLDELRDRKFIGHLFRIVTNIIEGKVLSKRGRKGKRTSILKIYRWVSTVI